MGNLQSYSWGCRAIGAVLSAYASGALLEAWGVRSVFTLTAALPILVVVAATLVTEAEREPSAKVGPSPLDGAAAQARELWGVVRKPEVYLPVLFLFSWQASPTSSSATFYFLTNEIKLSPEFLGRAQLVGALSSLAGIALYNRALAAVPIKTYLFWVNIVAVTIGFLPLLLITRMNLALGIPDEAFVLGDDIIQTVTGELAFMPVLVLAARICPPGVEATLFAFLMAVLNLSGFCATFLGSLLTDLLRVTESDFGNLPMLTLICNVSGLLPLALLGFVPETSKEARR
jgi:folate/biopterin transporter